MMTNEELKLLGENVNLKARLKEAKELVERYKAKLEKTENDRDEAVVKLAELILHLSSSSNEQ